MRAKLLAATALTMVMLISINSPADAGQKQVQALHSTVQPRQPARQNIRRPQQHAQNQMPRQNIGHPQQHAQNQMPHREGFEHFNQNDPNNPLRSVHFNNDGNHDYNH